MYKDTNTDTHTGEGGRDGRGREEGGRDRAKMIDSIILRTAKA